MFTERFGALGPSILAGLLTALVAAPAAADGLASRYTTTGALDTSFNNGTGKLISPGNVVWQDVLVEAGDKIVLCGSVNGQLAVARRLASGAADATFGLGGITTASWSSPATGVGCARASDGKIVVLSSAASAPNKDWVLTRFTATGQLDTTFGSGGFASVAFPNTPQSVPKDVKIDGDGKIVIAGTVNGDFLLVRHLATGARDTGFGWLGTTYFNSYDNQNETLSAIAIDASRRIVALGTQYGTSNTFVATRFSANGQPDTNFAFGGVLTFSDVTGDALAIDGAGKIVVAGTFGAPNSGVYWTARFDQDGFGDPTFNGISQIVTHMNAPNAPRGVAIGTDGYIVVAGYATHNGRARPALVRFSPTGQRDTPFGTNGALTTDYSPQAAEVNGLALDGSNRPVVAGRVFTP